MNPALLWHTVWQLGEDVDTDALAPGAYMQLGVEGIAPHCLENLAPAFAREVRPGDVIVAGRNFGIGSSREQAASALVHLGVAAVIARIAELAIERSPLRIVLPDGRALACEPVPDFLLAMAQAGGLLPQLRQRLAAQASSRL